MRKIKVLETIRQGKIGGGESHVLDLVKHMDREKFDPVVLSFTDGQMIECLNAMGIKNYVIQTERPFDFSKWVKVKQLIKEEEIDLVHAHGTRANTNIMWAAKQAGTPLIYTVHGWSFHDDQKPLVKKARVMAEKFLTQRTDLNISVSKSNQQTGQKHFGSFSSTVINNGIDLEKFNADGQFKDIRAEFNIPEHHTVIGYIARITKQKDPFTLLKAMEHVVDRDKNVTLLMVGDGDLKEAAATMAEALGITDHVIFCGYRTDTPDLLQVMDIYCLPSLWEGLPIGLIEAMAMKNAVIATEVDGSKEMVTHGVNGLLIPSRDHKALGRPYWHYTRMRNIGLNSAKKRFVR